MDGPCPHCGKKGCKPTYLVLYYPTGEVHTSPLKFKDKAIIHDFFGRDIFEKGMSRDLTEDQVQRILLRCKPAIKRCVVLKSLLPFIKKWQVFLESEEEHLLNMAFEGTDQAVTLVEFLMNKGSYGLAALYMSLRESSEEANSPPSHYQLMTELKETVHAELGPSTDVGTFEELDDEEDTSQGAHATASLTVRDRIKVKMYLKNLSDQNIYDIGVQLGLNHLWLKDMSSEELVDKVVLAWLQMDDNVFLFSGEPTWETLCTALKKCGHADIASAIQRNEGTSVHSEDVGFLVSYLRQYDYNWRFIGLVLNFRPSELEYIAEFNPHASPEQLLTKLLSQWSQWPNAKHPYSTPTLERLCEALRSSLVGLGTTATALYEDRSSLPSNQEAERRLRVHQRMIKAKHTVEICSLIFNYLGLPRSGKTSFRRRIMGEIINILLAREIEQPSTGVAQDAGQTVLLSKTEMGTITSSKVWTVIKEGDEANMIGQLLHQLAQKKSPVAPMATGNAKASPNSPVVAPNSPVVAPNHPEVTKSLLDSASNSSTNEDKETLSILSDALESEDWDQLKYYLDGLTLITNIDGGGHAEFLDLHAALIHGPSFNLLFSRLQDKLDEVFEISYTNKQGKSTPQGMSTLTVEEVMFQALANVACFGCPYFEKETEEKTDEEAELKIDEEAEKKTKQPVGIVSEKRKKELSGGSTSKVMLVCTHLDVIEDEKEREIAFAKKDGILQKKIEATKFYEEDIIKYVSDNQLMIKANNYNGDEQEIKDIQDILMKVISQSFDNKIKIPPSWLILSLYLRKNFSILRLKECQEIASKLKIKPGDLQDALWFLHHTVGVLLYYPEVEAMKDIVICKRQVVFDSASNLIRDTFTVDKVGHQRCWDFRERGQFSQKDLEKAMREAAKETKSDSLIPLDKLVSLFKHRNIITPISDSPSPTYFMPCVLRSAKKDMLNFCQGKTDPPSLMLCYNCGYTPLGIFPALITNLVSQQRKGWRLIKEGIYKNRIQFHVGRDFDKVILMSHPRYFEIAIMRAKSYKVQTSTLCADVRETVLSTLNEVTSSMNSHFNMKYSLAFECPKHPTREHLCIVENGEEKILCHESEEPDPLELEDYHKIWLPSSYFAAGDSTDTGTAKMSSCTLSLKDHAKITQYLADLGNQEICDIGMKLGIRYTRLERRMNIESLTNYMVQSWLRKDDDVGEVSGDPSWKTLCTALKKCGHTGIALNIEEKEIAM